MELPLTFVQRFHELFANLSDEVRVQFVTRDAFCRRLSRHDRYFRATFDQINRQLSDDKIASGYAAYLLVEAIELYGRAYEGRKLTVSIARLRRALATFRDQELRNYFHHFEIWPSAPTVSTTSLRFGFITELHGASYLSIERPIAGALGFHFTAAFRDRMDFPSEIAPDELVIATNLSTLFAPG